MLMQHVTSFFPCVVSKKSSQHKTKAFEHINIYIYASKSYANNFVPES